MSSQSDYPFRGCGPNFTTAIVEELSRVGNDRLLGDEDDDDTEYTEDQEGAYAELTKTVHERLLNDVDRRIDRHRVMFGAQCDAWSICRRGRIVIPLEGFSDRWNNLEGWPKNVTVLHGYSLTQDPSITERGSIGIIHHIGARYLNSYRGNDDSGDSGWLHYKIDWIQNGRETDIKVVEQVLRELQYRMTQMSIADTYLEIMEIAPPHGQSCCEYDARRNCKEIADKKHSRMRRAFFDRKVIFPRPVARQGRPFSKGMDYLIGAFHHADTPEDVAIKKLDTLVKTVDQYIEQEKERVNRDPEVMAKRRKLYHSFGLALGSTFPGSLSLTEWA